MRIHQLLTTVSSNNVTVTMKHNTGQTTKFMTKLSQFIGKGKGKGTIDLYSTSSQLPLMRSYMDHTVLPANDTIS